MLSAAPKPTSCTPAMIHVSWGSITVACTRTHASHAEVPCSAVVQVMFKVLDTTAHGTSVANPLEFAVCDSVAPVGA